MLPRCVLWATALLPLAFFQVLEWLEGKEKNVRALLCTLNSVLWEGVRWEQISMADVMTVKQVKQQYRKAARAVHPDKVSRLDTIDIVPMRMDRDVWCSAYESFNYRSFSVSLDLVSILPPDLDWAISNHLVQADKLQFVAYICDFVYAFPLAGSTSSIQTVLDLLRVVVLRKSWAIGCSVGDGTDI